MKDPEAIWREIISGAFIFFKSSYHHLAITILSEMNMDPLTEGPG